MHLVLISTLLLAPLTLGRNRFAPLLLDFSSGNSVKPSSFLSPFYYLRFECQAFQKTYNVSFSCVSKIYQQNVAGCVQLATLCGPASLTHNCILCNASLPVFQQGARCHLQRILPPLCRCCPAVCCCVIRCELYLCYRSLVHDGRLFGAFG